MNRLINHNQVTIFRIIIGTYIDGVENVRVENSTFIVRFLRKIAKTFVSKITLGSDTIV